MAKIIEPNLEMKLKSAITELQVAYDECKAALIEYYRGTGYNDDGELYVLDGHGERWARWCYCQGVLARQKAIVDGLKAMMEENKE